MRRLEIKGLKLRRGRFGKLCVTDVRLKKICLRNCELFFLEKKGAEAETGTF